MGIVERHVLPARKAEAAAMASGVAGTDDRDKAERFKALALPHLDDVYTLARYLMRSASNADDAVQESYLRAFRHFDTFRGGPIKPWLFAILRNVCHASHAGRPRLVHADDSETNDKQSAPLWQEESETPEQMLTRRSDTDTMRRLIGELPADFREVIVLRDINDLSYREIAAVIEAPIGTVMSRLARGREMLRSAWLAAEAGSAGK